MSDLIERLRGGHDAIPSESDVEVTHFDPELIAKILAPLIAPTLHADIPAVEDCIAEQFGYAIVRSETNFPTKLNAYQEKSVRDALRQLKEVLGSLEI